MLNQQLSMMNSYEVSVFLQKKLEHLIRNKGYFVFIFRTTSDTK